MFSVVMVRFLFFKVEYEKGGERVKEKFLGGIVYLKNLILRNL